MLALLVLKGPVCDDAASDDGVSDDGVSDDECAVRMRRWYVVSK